MMRRSSMVLVVLTAMFQGIPQAFGDYVLVQTFGTNGSGPGQFRTPYNTAVDSSGNVWVADYDNARIEEFTGQGNLSNVWHCGQRQCEPPISQGRYGGFIGKRLGRPLRRPR